jgi:hypothetical protein
VDHCASACCSQSMGAGRAAAGEGFQRSLGIGLVTPSGECGLLLWIAYVPCRAMPRLVVLWVVHTCCDPSLHHQTMAVVVSSVRDRAQQGLARSSHDILEYL